MNAVIKPVPCAECAVKDQNIAQHEEAMRQWLPVKEMLEAKVKDLEAKVIQQATCLAQKQSMLEFADARIKYLAKNGDRRDPPRAPDRRFFRGQTEAEKRA